MLWSVLPDKWKDVIPFSVLRSLGKLKMFWLKAAEPMFRLHLFLIYSFLLLATTTCVYYNTFYNARVYYQQGLKLIKTNPNTAKTNFEKAIAKSAVVVKNHFRSRWADDALFLVAMSYYHIGEYEKAVKNFEDFLAVFPESPYRDEANYYRGLTYLAKGDYGLASLIFYDLKENSPRFAQASAFKIAYSFFLKEDYNTAKDSLLAFIEEYPKAKERKDAILTLAEILYQLKEWAEAIDWYRIALKEFGAGLEPKERANIALKRAECFMHEALLKDSAERVKKLDSAQVILSQDYSRYPDLINQANLLLGKLFFAQGKDSLAQRYLTRIKTGKEQAEAYYLLGRRYEQAKEFEKAMAYYDTASRAGPNLTAGINAKKRRSLLNLLYPSTEVKDSAEAQFMVAELYGLALNEYEQALKEYEKTYHLFPNSPYAPKALYAQAWLLKNRLKRTDYDTIFKILVDRYPRTLYANAARKELGMPEIELLAQDTATGEQLAIPPKIDSLAKFNQTESLPVKTTPTETVGIAPPRPESTKSTPKRPEKILPQIHFDFDRYDIRSADTEALRMVANQLQADSTLKITIEGHCDPIGSDEYNEELGMRRALAAKNYLVQLGIAPERITVMSFGKKQLLTTDYNEYWRNRRCEFRFKSEAKE